MTRHNSTSTVYFTPEEVKRIRNTVLSTIQYASKIKGTPRQARDPELSIREATGASLMADMAGASRKQGEGETLPVLTIGQPYPPCTIATSELRPIRLADLRLETHHYGCKLMLRRAAGVRGKGVSAVVQLTARSWTLVQDVEGDGDVERLEVCLYTHRHGNDVLDWSGAKTLVVREPYFTMTEQGEATLRIDHPSDLEWQDEGAETSGRELKDQLVDAEAAVQQASRCKEQGNTALGARDPALACTHYTRGLSQLSQHQTRDSSGCNHTQVEAMNRDLHRNRAFANLLLSRFDAAWSDALSSLIEDPSTPDPGSLALNSKAYYRAGCAAYNLCKYEEAREFFTRRQQLTPKEGDAAIQRTDKRISERDNGAYDWAKLRAAAAFSRLREVDAASFLNRTRVGDSPGRGRGLFATCDIPQGGVVMCERAFCVAWGDGDMAATAVTYDVRDGQIRISPIGLARAVVEKLRGTPSYTEQIMQLHSDYRGAQCVHPSREVGSSSEIDVFRAHDIVSRNAFGLGPASSKPGIPGADDIAVAVGTGLWVHAARINHSCAPNTEKEFIGDMMLVRAKRPIVTGEELLHSYIDETSSYKARKEALKTTWGFECHCGVCEKQEGR